MPDEKDIKEETAEEAKADDATEAKAEDATEAKAEETAEPKADAKTEAEEPKAEKPGKKPAAKKAPKKAAAEKDDAGEKPAKKAAKKDDDAKDEKPKRRRRAKKADKAEEKKPAPSRRRRRRDSDEVPVVRATAKYVRVAPRKARLIADQVRGMHIEQARALLAFSPRGAAEDIHKLINSAAANAENNHDLVGDEMRITSITVDEGPTLRRYRPRALGRATPINKRTSHIAVALTPVEDD
jgi:ribosomal protein L22